MAALGTASRKLVWFSPNAFEHLCVASQVAWHKINSARGIAARWSHCGYSCASKDFSVYSSMGFELQYWCLELSYLPRSFHIALKCSILISCAVTHSSCHLIKVLRWLLPTFSLVGRPCLYEAGFFISLKKTIVFYLLILIGLSLSHLVHIVGI